MAPKASGRMNVIYNGSKIHVLVVESVTESTDSDLFAVVRVTIWGHTESIGGGDGNE